MTLPVTSLTESEINPELMVKAFFGPHHPLFSLCAIHVKAVKDGHGEMSMPFSDALADHRGALHRGMMVTLLDTCCGLSIFSALKSMEPIATIDLRVDYLAEIPPATGLTAVVDYVGRTDTSAFITGQAFADGHAKPIATVAGLFAIGTMGPSFDKNLSEQKA
ncbi:MAG: PaaI family thioesterase [Agitococcus sp.]|jgi:uncharacterized protein (TIGR00369 family)|nr:PaaI family thioesterase [Agitococcus sp.]